ncbi:MAG: PLDc N-terminal domain-containing protein [Acidimicrobiia bacterium]
MSKPQRVGVVLMTVVQFSLAIAAWIDLARRPAEQINGRKRTWAAVIGINFVGPILYFSRGRRSHRHS